MKTTLTPADLAGTLADLSDAEARYRGVYPGELRDRQPVHTVYGGAHIFKSGTADKLGDLALRSLAEHAPDAGSFAAAMGRGDEHAEMIYQRVKDKLAREAVEDFRIDFEDGYGNRPDDEEDAHAVAAAGQVATGMKDQTLPPFLGIRIKPFTSELRGRAIRSLDLFVTALAEATGGALPHGFVVTLPKVVIPEEVTALVEVLVRLEQRLGLTEGALKVEMMIETPHSIMAPDGACNLRRLLAAADGRCVAAHFGTYDYTASCDITAAYQTLTHPACDFAKHMMKVAFAGTGVMLSDGATVVMPVAPHRARPGESLSEAQVRENRAAVHRAWRMHYDNCRHSLVNGYYQGWDLHPAQLPVRYAAVYAFFLEGMEEGSARLKNFVNVAAQATLAGDVFDDAATGQGLLNFFLRALSCGALTEEEAVERSGLSLAELRTRSFLKILQGRRAHAS